ncbi:hypothetical protein [Nocardioides bruguierae]|uniref:hypothetical protein n=1 Tax=Nocardioides bruguierae TaxID=2945102 RepID=UPI0020205682|nr:hypothetical protein [Nocardioides bruguierae]MCL8026605.1 hypothetical protein [Nocardioides bruguierae]
MVSIIVAMVVVVALAGGILFYVAYPHQGRDVEGASWLSAPLIRAAFRLPVLRDGDPDTDAAAQQRRHHEDDAADERARLREEHRAQRDEQQRAEREREHAESTQG